MTVHRTSACIVNYWRHSLTGGLSQTVTPGKSRHWSQTRSQTTDEADKPRLRAIDLSQRVRERLEAQPRQPPLSSQQKLVLDLRRFSSQLQNVHPSVLAKHLHRSVLFQDEHVVVTNKPYGVPVRGAQ